MVWCLIKDRENLRSCVHFDYDSLNIYRSEKSLEQTVQGNIKHKFHIQHAFLVSLEVFNVQRVNVLELLRYALL
jgi:hypothetical protein